MHQVVTKSFRYFHLVDYGIDVLSKIFLTNLPLILGLHIAAINEEL